MEDESGPCSRFLKQRNDRFPGMHGSYATAGLRQKANEEEPFRYFRAHDDSGLSEASFRAGINAVRLPAQSGKETLANIVDALRCPLRQPFQTPMIDGRITPEAWNGRRGRPGLGEEAIVCWAEATKAVRARATLCWTERPFRSSLSNCARSSGPAPRSVAGAAARRTEHEQQNEPCSFRMSFCLELPVFGLRAGGAKPPSHHSRHPRKEGWGHLESGQAGPTRGFLCPAGFFCCCREPRLAWGGETVSRSLLAHRYIPQQDGLVLEVTARKPPGNAPGRDRKLGHGIIDPLAADGMLP